MYTYTSNTRLAQAGATTYNWDDNGNMTGRGSDTFSYDYADRMTQAVVGGITTTFTYNGDGLRVGKSVAGGASNSPMVWDIGLSLPLLISDSTYVYIYGNGPIGMVDAQGNAYYYLRDGLGSATGIVDSSGTLTATYSYDAYGNLRSSTGSIANSFRYTGEWYDSETGLYYLRARYYDPAVGRFVTRDPYDGSLKWPYSSNPYLYVENNPVNWGDPSGECGPECAVVASPPIWVAAGLTLAVIVYDLQHPDQIRSLGQWCAQEVEDFISWFARSNPQDKIAKRIARRYGLNEAGERALHDRITKRHLTPEEIEEEAEEIAKQPKYREGYRE